MIIINPGTGSVENSEELHAIENIHFVLDKLKQKNIAYVRIPERDENGRYCFVLMYQNEEGKNKSCEVDMPGISFTEETNEMRFPRMYVDGSSWIFYFGIDIICDRLFNN